MRTIDFFKSHSDYQTLEEKKVLRRRATCPKALRRLLLATHNGFAKSSYHMCLRECQWIRYPSNSGNHRRRLLMDLFPFTLEYNPCLYTMLGASSNDFRTSHPFAIHLLCQEIIFFEMLLRLLIREYEVLDFISPAPFSRLTGCRRQPEMQLPSPLQQNLNLSFLHSFSPICFTLELLLWDKYFEIVIFMPKSYKQAVSLCTNQDDLCNSIYY